jgi:hypothetical protein
MEAAQAEKVEDQEDLREAEVEAMAKDKAEGASKVEGQVKQALVAEPRPSAALRGLQHRRGHTSWQT